MAKKKPKNKNKLFLSFISSFLLLFSLSLIFFQISKKPKEVKAVPGQLNINAVSGGVQNFNQVGIGGDVTGSSAKLYVNGNVGIGTTAPGEKLDVVGRIRSQWDDTTSRIHQLEIRRLSSGSFEGTAFTIDVGMGQGLTNLVAGARINSSGSGYEYLGTRGASRIMLSDGVIRLMTGTLGGGGGQSAGTPVTFNTGLHMDSSGNVGIGTTSPVHNFQVYRTSLVNPSLTYSTGATAGIRTENIDIAFGAYTANPWAAWIQARHTSNQSWPLVINPLGGNVGIGTTVPNRRLELFNDISGLSFEAGTGSPNSGAIRFGDNTGWKLHFGRSRNSAGGPLNSGTAGVLMTIQDNGNVGIGTTGPQAKLHVIGDIKAQGKIHPKGEATGEYIINGQDAGLGDLGLGFYTAFQNRMYINNNGNVGIGTTTPRAKLHVVAAGGFGAEPIRAQSNSTFFSGVDAGGTVRFAINNDPGPTLNFYGHDTGGWFNFMTVNNTGSRAVSFNAGNVGIGTTSPQSKLSIGTSGSSNFAVYVDTGSSTGVYGYGINNGIYGYSITNGVYGFGRINGVYGYGSTGVYGYGTSTGVYSYGGSTGVYGYGGTYDFYAGNSSGKSYFAGNVGIGTPNPVQRLDVAGHIRIASNIYGNARTNYFLALQSDRNLCLYDNGSPVWCTYTHVSDIHLKKNIVDMEPVLDTLNKLRVIRFNYIDSADDGTHQQHIGMIAQEVEKYYPDMVYTAPNNQKLINYGKFSALLLQGLKDQQKEIKSLKHSLDDISLNSSDDVVIVENNLGYSIKNKNDSFITRISAFAQLVVAKIQAGLIETKKLIVDGVDIVKKISELEQKLEKQEQIIRNQQKEIEALKEIVGKLKK